MTTLIEIENSARALAEAREDLNALGKCINTEIEAVYGQHRSKLRRMVGEWAAEQARCEMLVRNAPELFEKPRTQVFHGIKVGFRKGVGGLDWDDDDAVVQRIEKMFGKQAEGFLIISKTPAKDILADLPASDLKTLGITVEKTGDVVVVKAVDTAVDKTVKALLKHAAKELEEA